MYIGWPNLNLAYRRGNIAAQSQDVKSKNVKKSRKSPMTDQKPIFMVILMSQPTRFLVNPSVSLNQLHRLNCGSYAIVILKRETCLGLELVRLSRVIHNAVYDFD